MKAVQHKTAEPASGATSSFFKKGGNAALNNEAPFFTKSSAIQTKLTVGQPNDKYEQEADSVADKVVQRLSEPGVQMQQVAYTPIKPFIQSKCAECEQEEQLQKKDEEKEQHESSPEIMKKAAFGDEPVPPPPGGGEDEKEETLQRKCAACEKEKAIQKKGDAGAVSPALEKNITASKGSGAPLPEGVRTNMESSMGADFSNVRIHTGSNAVSMNKQLRAQAFTQGNDIFFNSGKYDPGNKAGQHLLAHELTHTIQQGQSKPAAVHARMLRMKREVMHLQAQLAAHADSVMTKTATPNLQTDLLGDLSDFATSSFGSLEELLGIELPSGPLEAIRMIVNAAENNPTAVSLVPGLSLIILQLKAVVVISDLIQEVIDHKEEIMEAVRTFLNEKIAEAPDLILTIMSAVTGIDKNHLFIIFNYYFPAALDNLASTDWWDVLVDVLWEQLWPFEGITTIVEPDPNNRSGLGRDLGDLFDHVGNALSALSELRISQAGDELLFVSRSVNVLAGRFYGWVALIIIAAEAIMGGIAGAAAGGAGAIPGAVAGAGTGVATADTIGYVLLAASAATELAILVKSVASLHPVHEALTDGEKANENHNYYTQITQSAISLGIMGALAVVAYLAGKAAGAIMSKLYELLPKNVQQLMDEFIRAYAARRAALLGGAPEPNTGGNGSGGSGGSGSGGSGSGTGGGSTGDRPPLRVIQGGGQGSTGGGGSTPTRGNLALNPVPHPEMDPRINPIITNPDPRFPPHLQPVPDPVPVPVTPPVPGTPTVPGATPGTGIGIGIGTDPVHDPGRDDTGGDVLYQWQTPYMYQSRNGRINYTGATRPGVSYVANGHHPWPKTLGGPDLQTLITIIVSIHQEEIHYGRSPVNSPIVAAMGSIYNYLTIAINASPDFGIGGINVLQGRRLTHPGGPGSGNELLITRMTAGDTTAYELASFVRDTLTAYYGVFSAFSSPVIPYITYRQGLDDSFNAIV